VAGEPAGIYFGKKKAKPAYYDLPMDKLRLLREFLLA